MELVIAMLQEQIRLSENRLETNHYPTAIEPSVRQKIKECNKAITILREIQNTSTKDEALPIDDVVGKREQLVCPHCKGKGEYIDTHPERYGLITCECQEAN